MRCIHSIVFSILFFHASFHAFFHVWLTRSACSKVINLSTTVHRANVLIRTACALVDREMVIIEDKMHTNVSFRISCSSAPWRYCRLGCVVWSSAPGKMLVTRVLTTVCCSTLCLIDSWSQYLLPITWNRNIVGHGVWPNGLVISKLAIFHDVTLHTWYCKTTRIAAKLWSCTWKKIAKQTFKHFQEKNHMGIHTNGPMKWVIGIVLDSCVMSTMQTPTA